MKLRIMGTKDECERTSAIFNTMSDRADIENITVSRLYKNRGSSNQYRVYIDITFTHFVTPELLLAQHSD